ncbi:hypothetical protein RRG08_059471 [Elysia crispata]|uniref:Uncharacterized protein n=1 Tax=Elysia crispata TaxID=231223 RepID=A0AAE1DS75_9GAST|nr:hypothetical protein RRG08_059471 [Elysia crispata]
MVRDNGAPQITLGGAGQWRASDRSLWVVRDKRAADRSLWMVRDNGAPQIDHSGWCGIRLLIQPSFSSVISHAGGN